MTTPQPVYVEISYGDTDKTRMLCQAAEDFDLAELALARARKKAGFGPMPEPKQPEPCS